jgi:hypothetical protein
MGDEGVLLPVDYDVEPSGAQPIQPLRLPTEVRRLQPRVSVRCPPDLPRDVVARLRAHHQARPRTLGVRDLGRVDFRLGDDGRIYLLEVNALPSLERGASTFAAAAREGLDYADTLQAIVQSAARRQGLIVKPGASEARRPSRCASASRSTSSASIRSTATTPRPSTTRPRPSIRSATLSRATAIRWWCSRPRRAAAAAHGDAGRSGVQHRRGRRRPQPRGGGPGAVRADGDPLHGLGRRHAVHRARQGAVQAGAAASTGS